MADTVSTTVDTSNPETWEAARSYASQIGQVSSLFGQAIRCLLSDQNKGEPMSRQTKMAVRTISGGDSMKSLLYWAARTYRSYAIADKPSLTVNDLIEPYGPYDLAALLGLMYLYKKLKRRANPEDWGPIAAPMHLNVEIGGFLGDSMANIGFGNGILIGAIRHLSIATVLIHDKKGIKEYRTHCKMKRLEFDQAFELERWGCTHAQISSILIQSLGFGIPAAESFSTGLGTEIPADRLKKAAYMARIAPIWIQSLRDKGTAPDIVHRGDFYPLTESLTRLLAEAKRIKENGSRYTWLDRSKEDISPQTTPELFGGAQVTTVEELDTELPTETDLEDIIDEEEE